MKWNHLTEESQLADIRERSATVPQVIFKHSTRCSVSMVALGRLGRGGEPDGVDFHLLDLLKYRDLSGKVAETFSVQHQSPQVLLILNGTCTYNESHFGIEMPVILEKAKVTV
jgi:bacillithiol system protein YtxJ